MLFHHIFRPQFLLFSSACTLFIAEIATKWLVHLYISKFPYNAQIKYIQLQILATRYSINCSLRSSAVLLGHFVN